MSKQLRSLPHASAPPTQLRSLMATGAARTDIETKRSKMGNTSIVNGTNDSEECKKGLVKRKIQAAKREESRTKRQNGGIRPELSPFKVDYRRWQIRQDPHLPENDRASVEVSAFAHLGVSLLLILVLS